MFIHEQIWCFKIYLFTKVYLFTCEIHCLFNKTVMCDLYRLDQ